jgi:hypothetical protein
VWFLSPLKQPVPAATEPPTITMRTCPCRSLIALRRSLRKRPAYARCCKCDTFGVAAMVAMRDKLSHDVARGYGLHLATGRGSCAAVASVAASALADRTVNAEFCAVELALEGTSGRADARTGKLFRAATIGVSSTRMCGGGGAMRSPRLTTHNQYGHIYTYSLLRYWRVVS